METSSRTVLHLARLCVEVRPHPFHEFDILRVFLKQHGIDHDDRVRDCHIGDKPGSFVCASEENLR